MKAKGFSGLLYQGEVNPRVFFQIQKKKIKKISTLIFPQPFTQYIIYIKVSFFSVDKRIPNL